MEENKSKISNMEWYLVISALFCIDIIQIFIDIALGWLGGLGLIITRVIDIFVGMSFAFYLQWRGQSMVTPKRLFGFLATLGLEMIPVVGDLPLWGLDGIFNMVISKSDKILSNIPGGGIIEAGMNSSNLKSGVGENVINQINSSTRDMQRLNEAIKSRNRG